MGVLNTALSYPVNCSNFTAPQFERLTIARGSAGAVSVFVCCVVLLLIVVKRGYTSVLQRFLLYLTLATLFVEASFVMQLEHLANYTWQKEICIAVAFIDQWGGTIVISFSMEITLVLVGKVYGSVYGRCLNGIAKTKCQRIILESSAVCVALALPLAGAIVPFQTQTYGLNGAWCWITIIDYNCHETDGYWEQIAFWYVPVTVLGVLIGLCIIAIILLFCVMTFNPAYNHTLSRKLVKDNLVLFGFYLLFILANGGDYYRLYTGTTHRYIDYGMWYVSAIVPAFAKLFLPLGFLVYMYSFKAVSLGFFKKLWCGYRKPGDNVAHVHTQEATFKTSHPRQYPSETVIYTGAFPSVLSHTNQEQQPLMAAGRDTGYSSI